MAFKNGYRLWDDEYKRAHWTPEEIATSDEFVSKAGEIIEAEQAGYITHEEAMIRHFMLDPDLAETELEDAILDGDIEKIRSIWRQISIARERLYEYPLTGINRQEPSLTTA